MSTKNDESSREASAEIRDQDETSAVQGDEEVHDSDAASFETDLADDEAAVQAAAASIKVEKTTDPKLAGFRKTRHMPSLYNLIMTYGGVVIIVAAIARIEVSSPPKYVLAAIVFFGLLCHQIGVWHIASSVSSRRKYLGLRQEVDDFILLVRQLNTHTLNHEEEAVATVKEDMYASLERMFELAGKEAAAAAASEGAVASAAATSESSASVG